MSRAAEVDRIVAGVDEAGRGPLAGPVVAAAVILAPGDSIDGLADSKRLSARERERLAELIRARALAWAVGSAERVEIDSLNILRATLLAMRRALLALGMRPEHVCIDGTHAPPLADLGCTVETVIGGDARVPVISAASILAKTHRDALMRVLDARYPGYGFGRHKGYGTAAHLEALQRLGPTGEHRRSFAPVRALCTRGG
jgi:ribonuclease HII